MSRIHSSVGTPAPRRMSWRVSGKCISVHLSPCIQRNHQMLGRSQNRRILRFSIILSNSIPKRDPNDNDSNEFVEEDGRVSIDLKSLEGGSRRSMLVGFTCDACGGRSERLVNPLAWAKGMVIVQCAHCKAWHKIADANNMVEEYRFDCSDDD